MRKIPNTNITIVDAINAPNPQVRNFKTQIIIESWEDFIEIAKSYRVKIIFRYKSRRGNEAQYYFETRYYVIQYFEYQYIRQQENKVKAPIIA
ncbi:MAG: hypothetical protein J7L47_09165 [Candidatus Odinarchaeota archaeon]|nr:hypothetical protein [Candidatus Odinarchaeota archaeon]